MIEQALRKRLQPTVNRRRRLYLALWLSACWFIALVVGIGLIGAYWLWGWTSSAANWVLCISTVLVTLLILYKSLRLRVDYKAVARDIEHKHPDLKSLLLTAIEQKPDKPGGSLNYLQERVIGEAVRHAVKYDWLRSVSSTKLVLAQITWILMLTLLMGAMSQLLLPRPFLLRTTGNVLAQRGYQITVTPGDTDVESGTPVVVLARFEGRVPEEVTLVFEAADEEPQQITLTKNLEDPVFGGIIPQVDRNLLYRIEYADRSTQDYHINVYEHPTLTKADAKIVYPDYTKLPEKIIQDTRRVSAIEGSQITLTFTLNKAVATAQLAPKEGPALDLTVDSEHPNVYTTSITAMDNRRYELNLVDAQGLKNEIPQRFTIDVHKNLPPEIKPVFPNRDVLASPLEELSLEADVSDDYGITRYGMSYALAGVQNVDITLGPLADSQQKQSFQHLLALEDLGAQPDQLMTYYFWADDIGPDGNNRRASSDMYFTEVRHFEEIFRESESSQNQNQQNQNQQGQQQGQRGGQLAELQKQIISATWNIKRQADQSGGLDNQKEDLNVVLQSQADVLEQSRSTLSQTQEPPAMKALQAATKHMETSLDHLTEAGGSSNATELMPALAAEQSAYQELLKLRDREHQVTQSRSANANNTPRSARSERQLQQLELRQRENRYETERLAQSQEQTTQREDLQVQNRLRDLARRQSEMTDKLKEAETTLRQAQNEQEREEINRELKRLRDEQLEALRDVDELQERMERPENRQRMSDTRQQLDQSRSRIRQSAEELERGMVSRAITSTTRAQRELEQMRDQFQRNTSSQFSEQMRQMREQAQQLDERQKEIASKMQGQQGSEQKTLRDSSNTQNLADRMNQQKESMENLIDQMKDVSEQAETSEPLLSRKLYETVRETSTKNIDRDLEVAGELIRRNFLPQAQEIEKRAGQGIEELRKGVEEAAESVLGNETEALRLAREQLDELIREVNEEVARANASGRQEGDPNILEEQTSNQQQRADAQRGTGPGQESDPNQPGNMQSNQQANAQRGAGQGQSGDPNRPQESQANQRPLADGRSRTGQRRLGDRRSGGRTDPRGWGGNQGAFGPWEQVDPNGPLTGRDFTQWSDRLRDVEEMMNESEMRAEAARIRDRARAIRAEFTRHGKEPQWDLVRQMITKPLAELRDRISEELSALESDEAMVPIDRDPVPGRFADLVRRYYENLGDQK